MTPASAPPDGWDGKEYPAVPGTQVRSLGWEDPLEKGMATHSSSLAQRIIRTEEPRGLQSMDHKESDTTERLQFTVPGTDV